MKLKKMITSGLALLGLIGSGEILANDSCYAPQMESCCENHYYVGADYLYWRVWQEGLDRAGIGPQFTGPIRTLTFDWSSGFRVRAGAEFCCNWGIEGQYTYLRPKGTKTISANQIFPTTLPSFVAGGVNFSSNSGVLLDSGEANYSSIHSKVNMNYNLIDIECYTSIWCTPCFDFRFLTGVQVGLIDESATDIHAGSLAISADRFGQTTLTGSIPVQIDWIQGWDFAGTGLRLGLEGTYTNSCGFFIESDFHFALLFGKYKNKNNRTIPVFDTSSLTGTLLNESVFFEEVFNEYYFISMTETYHDFVSNANLDIKFGWEYWWSCLGFKASVAYDVTYWWDLSVFRKGLTGNAMTTASSTTDAQFLFAGTASSTKLGKSVALHGLVVSLDFIY